MKEKRSLFVRFVIGVSCVVCIMLNACANEEFISNDLPTNGVTFGKNDVLTIEAAKTWFSDNNLPVCEMRASDNTQGILVRPSWNHAKEWKNRKYEVVETALITQTSIIFYDEETKNNIDWEKDFKKVKNVGRMVFLTDLETGKTRNFIMIIIGNYKYLMKKDNKLSKNNYLFREPKFDGRILFYEPDGGFINGWEYKNGKITHTISPADNNESSLPVLTRSTTECGWVNTYYDYYECTESNSAEFGGLTGNNTNGIKLPEVSVKGCAKKTGITSSYACPNNGGDNNNDVSGGSGGVGGGSPVSGGDSQQNPPQNVTYNATITGTSRVDLLDYFYFTPTVTPSASIVNVKYEIGKNLLAFEKWTLQDDGQQICSVRAITPGEWFVRATITLSDTVIISNTLSVDVTYPTVDEIMDNTTVISQMESVWQDTKNFASVTSVREEAFWIYLNTISMSYEFGETVLGYTNLNYCNEISQLAMPLYSEVQSSSPLVGGKYAVAWFHTHTPKTYCADYYPLREVGASDTDKNSFPDFPGLLYDYQGEIYYGKRYVYPGHILNASAQVTPFGPYRRSNY
jgi:hypothetical protein